MKRPVDDTERSRLGLDAPISRRDFFNGSLAAAGSALALPASPAIADTFTGYGGVGDYARANGNTRPVVQAAHRLRVAATARPSLPLRGTPPGFHYGIDGRPSPLERVRQGYGRISIGHSELNGAQHWGSALEYGRKAGERAAAAA